MEQFVIEVKNVSKSFKGIPVLNDINITCRNGKIYGIIGYNGSGKTVLFKCICGFLHVDSGEISVNGRVMGKEMDMLEHAGIIIEEPGYIRNLSGYRNLEYLYRITHKKDPAVIHSIMLKVGLDPQSRKKVCHYSLGMRQRLAIAQATMEDQAILILDEPMNGLDKEGVAEMRKFFLEQKEMGKLILLASHNKDDIELLCDEVYEMNHGILAMYSKST
ncbi:ABC transporter ATP-binding protein [uncultured Acetatifactor sp.]|uniref:ABC transporter ATP-binding protein n=1 Tax=uncultured Acetatifactor sp. TaxID=1671927 RepID=UPI00262B58FA|nr:ATP-binding cassette domain-containing protein [uncultured Acetatifactor sp.]